MRLGVMLIFIFKDIVVPNLLQVNARMLNNYKKMIQGDEDFNCCQRNDVRHDNMKAYPNQITP